MLASLALFACRRPQRLGLGAAPAPEQQQQKKYIKPGGCVGGVRLSCRARARRRGGDWPLSACEYCATAQLSGAAASKRPPPPPLLPPLPLPLLPPSPTAGETRDQRDLVYVDPQTGATQASKPVGEALVERRKEGVHPGKVRWWWYGGGRAGEKGGGACRLIGMMR